MVGALVPFPLTPGNFALMLELWKLTQSWIFQPKNMRFSKCSQSVSYSCLPSILAFVGPKFSDHFYWFRIRVGHPCQEPVANPWTSKGQLSVVNIPPPSQFTRECQNWVEQAWVSDAWKLPLGNWPKTRIRRCMGQITIFSTSTKLGAHFEAEHNHIQV